jgi:hypothetical protein
MDKFVTVLLNGGLGNQLYQYAFGRALSIKHACKLNLDISVFGTIHNTWNNSYVLNNFDIDKKTVISKNFSVKQLYYLKFLKKFFKKDSLNLKFSKLFFKEKYNRFYFDWDFKKQRVNILENSAVNSIYFGYWQDIKYFESIKYILMKELKLKNVISDKVKQISKNVVNPNSVAVHIRGGDIEFDNNFKHVDDKYYINAIKFFKNKLGKVQLNVMTDDIGLAKKQISKIIKDYSNIFFINELQLSDLEEFYLFGQHKNLIASRSTFSWWSSYLCEDKNKLITIPSEWYKSEKTPNSRIAENMLII